MVCVEEMVVEVVDRGIGQQTIGHHAEPTAGGTRRGWADTHTSILSFPDTCVR